MAKEEKRIRKLLVWIWLLGDLESLSRGAAFQERLPPSGYRRQLKRLKKLTKLNSSTSRAESGISVKPEATRFQN